MKLAQILATLDAFGLHARGSTTLTGAPGPADRLDKLLQHLGLSGSKLASGGFGRIRHFLLSNEPNEPVGAGRFTRVLAGRWVQDRGALRGLGINLERGASGLELGSLGHCRALQPFYISPILYVNRLKGCSSQRKDCHTSTSTSAVRPVRSRDSRHCNSSVADPFSESGEDCRPVGNATELQRCEAPSQAILLLSPFAFFSV
jgi:hypothetical protein